jgi:hypothetical protein
MLRLNDKTPERSTLRLNREKETEMEPLESIPQVQVESYAVQLAFLADGSLNWNWATGTNTTPLNSPTAPCQIPINPGADYAVIVFTLQPMAQNTETLLLNGVINWENGSPPASVIYATVNYSNQTLIIVDDNSNADSYGFKFQVQQGNNVYTSPDPIIVNTDTGGNMDCHHRRPRHKRRHRLMEDVVEIRESIEVAQTTGN